jgi:ABC-type multidrug transport system fused ATPase/permease subunit
MGEITNLVATDTQKLYDVMIEAHNIWSCPVLIVAVSCLLWTILGPQLTIGVAILLLFLPICQVVVARMLHLRSQRSRLTDTRINVLTTMLQGIRVTKLNHYESQVEQHVRTIRSQEMILLHKELSMWGWVLVCAITSPLLATSVAFSFYALVPKRDVGGDDGGDVSVNILTPANVFSGLLLFTILRFPINMTARLVGKTAQAVESIRRISHFLQRPIAATRKEEQQPSRRRRRREDSEQRHDGNDEDDDESLQPVVDMKNGAFCIIPNQDEILRDAATVDAGASGSNAKNRTTEKRPRREQGQKQISRSSLQTKGSSGSKYMIEVEQEDDKHEDKYDDEDDDKESASGLLHQIPFIIRDLNFQLHKGELLAVVGKVGSGKTVLLQALLGEVPPMDATVLCSSPTPTPPCDTTTETTSSVSGVSSPPSNEPLSSTSQQQPADAASPSSSCLTVAERVAYAPQIPFIINKSLRENVLFGSKYHPARYEEVLDACCLRHDIQRLGPAGDLTQIGERGVTFSGGQKQRVALARAVYAQADLTLLDDCFSALDPNTARRVFDGLFGKGEQQKDANSNDNVGRANVVGMENGDDDNASDGTVGLLRHGGTILVTHAVHFLPRADKILILSEGTPLFFGTWEELQQGNDKTKMIVEDHDRTDVEIKSNSRQQQFNAKLRRDGILEEDGFIMTIEERQYGISSFGTWLQWFSHAGGWSFFISQLLFLIIDRGFYVAGDWWLARWADAAYTGMDIGNIHFPPQTDGREAQARYVAVYIIIVALSVFATIIRSQWACTYIRERFLTISLPTIMFLLRCSHAFRFFFASSAYVHNPEVRGGARCARKMFDAMTIRILRAPLSYFDTTPLGRILNRFTYDVEVLDVELSVSMTGLMVSFSWLMSAIIVVIAVLPWIMLGMIPVTAVYCLIQYYYRMSGPDLQRIDAVSRSPLQAGLAESTFCIHKERFSASAHVPKLTSHCSFNFPVARIPPYQVWKEQLQYAPLKKRKDLQFNFDDMLTTTPVQC